MDRFMPVCPRCGKEGHFPKDCPWTMLTVAAVVPFGSAALVIHFVMFI